MCAPECQGSLYPDWGFRRNIKNAASASRAVLKAIHSASVHTSRGCLRRSVGCGKHTPEAVSKAAAAAPEADVLLAAAPEANVLAAAPDVLLA